MFPRQQENTGIMEAVISTQSVPRCYKQDQSFRELMGFIRGKLLVLEAGSRGRGQFGNPEEGEYSPLEAATKQRQ
jgi:hypothetical protein